MLKYAMIVGLVGIAGLRTADSMQESGCPADAQRRQPRFIRAGEHTQLEAGFPLDALNEICPVRALAHGGGADRERILDAQAGDQRVEAPERLDRSAPARR